MRRLTVAALLAIAALTLATAAGATVQAIYVTNDSTIVTDAWLQDALTCFQRAVTDDFAPFWPTDAQLLFGPPPAGDTYAWTISVTDESDVPNAEAYHYVNEHGVPAARVFARTTFNFGDNWEVAFTHELFEMLADPYTNAAVQTAHGFYALEVADPVEDDSFAYWRLTDTGAPCALSDFVTPNWYRQHGGKRYDFTGYVRRPLQLLKGGYQIVWQPWQGWTAIFATGGRHTMRTR